MQHQQDIDQLQQCPREKHPMGYKNNKRKKYSDGLEFPEKMVDDGNYSTLQQYTNSLLHASGTHHNHKLRTPLECEGEGVSPVVLNNCSLTIYTYMVQWYRKASISNLRKDGYRRCFAANFEQKAIRQIKRQKFTNGNFTN